MDTVGKLYKGWKFHSQAAEIQHLYCMFRVMYDFVVSVCIYCMSFLGASFRSGVGFMGKLILPRGNSRTMPSYMLVDDSSQFEFTRLIRAPNYAIEINICTFCFLRLVDAMSTCPSTPHPTTCLHQLHSH